MDTKIGREILWIFQEQREENYWASAHQGGLTKDTYIWNIGICSNHQPDPLCVHEYLSAVLTLTNAGPVLASIGNVS